MAARLFHRILPARLFETWSAIDRRHDPAQAPPRHHAWIIMGTVVVCLLVLHYLKNSSALRQGLRWLDGQWGTAWLDALLHSEHRQLFGYLWWGSWHLVCYVLIPVLVIKLWLRGRVMDYGLRWGSVHRDWGWYLLLALPIMGFAIIASFSAEFSEFYPFYDLAGRSMADLLVWEFIYLSQFLFLEFFFRGFMLRGLAPHFASSAILIMVLPYTMIHFPKLWPEATGAILFGLFLGTLALRSGSIWGGFLVHATIALTMDFAALTQRGEWPRQLLP